MLNCKAFYPKLNKRIKICSDFYFPYKYIRDVVHSNNSFVRNEKSKIIPEVNNYFTKLLNFQKFYLFVY